MVPGPAALSIRCVVSAAVRAPEPCSPRGDKNCVAGDASERGLAGDIKPCATRVAAPSLVRLGLLGRLVSPGSLTKRPVDGSLDCERALADLLRLVSSRLRSDSAIARAFSSRSSWLLRSGEAVVFSPRGAIEKCEFGPTGHCVLNEFLVEKTEAEPEV